MQLGVTGRSRRFDVEAVFGEDTSLMPISSGVKDQANGTTLATRSFSLARAGDSIAIATSKMTLVRDAIARAGNRRLISFLPWAGRALYCLCVTVVGM